MAQDGSGGTLSVQQLAEILRGGVRTKLTRRQTKPFLEEIARGLQEQVGELDADVGVRAQKDTRKRGIQFLDRAWFRLDQHFPGDEPGKEHTLHLGVLLLPGRVWWGFYAWGSRTFVERLRPVFERSGLIEPGDQILVGHGGLGAEKTFPGGGYFAFGHQLTADEVATQPDTAALATTIANALASRYGQIVSRIEELRATMAASVSATLPPGPPESRRYWKVSAGRGGSSWPEFRDHNRIGIGYNIELDLLQVAAQKDLVAALQSQGRSAGAADDAARQAWLFSRGMRVGDAVVAYGSNTILAVGHITGDYQFAPGEDYAHLRAVRWVDLTARPASSFSPELRKHLRQQTTIVELTQAQFEEIRGEEALPIPALVSFLAANGFHFSHELAATYYLALQTKPFVILSGISGTGKTKLAQLFAAFVSPQRPRNVEETVEPEQEADTFALTINPYVQTYSRIHIPKALWDQFPELDVGEKRQIRVQISKGEEKCQLTRRHHPQMPNGYLELLFTGTARQWVRNEVEVGDVIEVRQMGAEDDPVYRFRKHTAPKRVRTVTESFSAFVPVHPDWTDHRGLLGFAHLLTGTYYATDFLRLILRAHTNWFSGDRQPYFAILDEMNLARVEHYFADFLSVLESRRLVPQPASSGALEQECFPLHDHPRCLLATGNQGLEEGYYLDEEGGPRTCAVQCDGCPFAVLVHDAYHRRGEFSYSEAARVGFDPLHFIPPRLLVPLNVHFSGTVNVDETTFTFSPKVLDRAFVIEFDEVDLETYWRQPGTDAAPIAAEAGVVSAFTHDRTYPFVLVGRSPEVRATSELAPYRTQLEALVRLLEPSHMHFAYRVADEVLAYLSNARRLNDPGFPLEVAFDHALLHKLLPRFHGAAGRLREPVHILLAFCGEAGRPQEGDNGQTLAERVTAQSTEWKDATWTDIRTKLAQARLRLSAEKLLRMLHDLDTEGFTSFT